MPKTIRLGISTCPNDTFAFHGLLHRLVDWRGLHFEVELLDIQQLNHRVQRSEFDVAKTSFHAALKLTEQTVVLPSGSALGFGVGPLLLAAGPDSHPTNSQQITLCPGADTTGTLLFELFYPNSTQVQQVVFSEIMPRLQQRSADFGVCIHEGRFTWRESELYLVEDLGTRWEIETKCPLPLGGILAKRSLGYETLDLVQTVIRESLTLALDSPELPLPTMRQYAQEFDDEVLMQHVKLYVNDWTLDLGQEGERALRMLSQKAEESGIISSETPPLTILHNHLGSD